MKEKIKNQHNIWKNGSGSRLQADETWTIPKPETIPPPTYWPAVLAFGTTLVGFGMLTSYLISLVGAGIFVLAISKWIGEMLHEQKE